jgi:hypothetical protein
MEFRVLFFHTTSSARFSLDRAFSGFQIGQPQQVVGREQRRSRTGRILSRGRIPRGLRVRHQPNGRPLPEIGSVNGDPLDYRERLAKFGADQGISLEYSEEIAPARGTSSGGKTTLLPGQPPAEEFATLAHETAHLCGAGIYVALSSDACRKRCR